MDLFIITVRNVVAARLLFHRRLSFCSWGRGRYPGQTPPRADPPADPPGKHPLSSACWDTYTPTAQCMLGYDEHCSGRYASYWNAFLFPCKISYKNVKSNHSPCKWRGQKESILIVFRQH